MKTRLLVVLAVLLAIPMAFQTASAGTTGSIAGQITDSKTKEPIIGASVILKGTNIGAQTDLDGKYAIFRIDPGSYTLVISGVGYASTEVKGVIVRADQTTVVKCGLTTQASKGKEVTVKATRDVISKFDVNSLKYKSHEQIKTAPVQKVDDLLRTVGSVKTTTNGEVYIRGGRVGEVGYIIDGRGCLKPSVLSNQPSALPPFDMFFKDFGTNGWVRAAYDSLSTFAIDVDDASYNIVKQYLVDGNMPPADAVRVEEFVNHFDYGYRPPQSGKFRIFTETSFSPFDARTAFFKVGIKGREISTESRLPLRLTFVIDISGSMGYDDRLELVKQALTMIAQQMTSDDQIGIVTFGSVADDYLQPTSGAHRAEIIDKINGLYAGGSTYAEAGLRMGYEMAAEQYASGRTNRIILCSDGVANVGQTGPDEIMREVTRNAQSGITLSTFGVGMGNYNDVLLEKLAQKGNGRYAYINNWDEARRQFVDELVSNVQVIARDVKIQVAFDPDVVSSYRLLGYENRAVADDKFRDNKTDGGEIGAGHEVTAIYELQVNRHPRSEQLATVNVRWKEPSERTVSEVHEIATFDPKSCQFEGVRAELQLAIVASRFAEMIKGTPFTEATSYDELHRLAERICRNLPNDQTRELADLISRAGTLSEGNENWHASQDDDDGNNYKR